ncbi:hypothetical protein RchiOBHm_Chr5g0018871 [Rosa chinensis]|uniref:Zinc knuckle CX2CX4HX4C domain-containing protein n=1 Tax=Rosa chinensis TaxID=74649 RepID=A0A2P6Q6U5_ROSCH|nr:hypothetical protein RchiOBHm_Chr5g0018871 [Rosa chinensis]
MTARLATKLSLKEGEEPVDLGNLRVPGKEFLARNFYLVGRLNTCRGLMLDSFRSAVRSMWRLTGVVEVQPRGDRFLFTFTHDRDVARVKKGGPWGFQQPTVRLVGGTIGEVLEVDRPALRRGDARVRLVLSIHDPVHLDRRVRVSPSDVLTLRFRYERLLGRCHSCAMLNHGGQRCLRVDELAADAGAEQGSQTAGGPIIPALVFRANVQPSISSPLISTFKVPGLSKKKPVQIRELPALALSGTEGTSTQTQVVGMRRPRAEDAPADGKRAKHGLALAPVTLQPENLGFEFSDAGLVGGKLSQGPKVYKKKGRPRGSRNKVKAALVSATVDDSGSMGARSNVSVPEILIICSSLDSLVRFFLPSFVYVSYGKL